MDAYLLLAAAIFGGVVVSLLWSIKQAPPEFRVPSKGARLDDGSPQHSRLYSRMVDAHEEVPVSEAGPYSRLSARLTDLEHAFKLLSNEWADKESRIDAILKRVHRLRKLEEVERQAAPEADEPTNTLSAAEQRAAIWRKAQGGR